MDFFDFLQVALQIIDLPGMIAGLSGYTPGQKFFLMLLAVVLIASDLNSRKKAAKKKD